MAADSGEAKPAIAEFARQTETKPAIRDLLCGGDTNFAKGLAPMDKAVVEELESKHAALHALIEEEEHRTLPDEDLLHRLKKEKLRLKDELAGHYTQH
ncbi:MAG: YdcH family protein [Sphingomicrobium sp.]